MAASSELAEIASRLNGVNLRLSRVIESRNPTPAETFRHQLRQERSRIARELHAGAGQPLAALKLHLELLLEDAPAYMKPAVTGLQDLADAALSQVRSVSHSLHPQPWRMTPLPQALRSLILLSGLESCFEVTLDIPHTAEIPYYTQGPLYRSAQEAIANVLRHSAASAVHIQLVHLGNRIRLSVTDNGKGFEPERITDGMGLDAIRRYARELGGTADFNSRSGKTEIVVVVPVEDR